jgi:hypothetical protein
VSYAPGYDGPPIAELGSFSDKENCDCPYLIGDWYYGERYGDSKNSQTIYSCKHGHWRTEDLT